MKNKLLTLFKTSFKNTYKFKSMSKKKKIISLLLTVYVVASIVFTLGLFSSFLLKTLRENNLVNYFIPLIFSLASLFSFVFTIFNAKASLFENKDNNLLFALPINRKTILLSRFLSVAMYNFLIGLLIIIPGLALYIYAEGITVVSLISIISMIMFLPIIPSLLASIFGYLIAKISSKAKNKSRVELISYVLFIAVYFLLMNNAQDLLMKLVTNVDLMNKILKVLFLPIYLISQSIIKNNIIYIFIFIAINLVCIFLFISIFSKGYFKIISNMSSEKAKSNYTMKSIKTNSKMKALIKKEMKKYFSSAIYVFNTLFGVVFFLIGAIASLFYSPEVLIKLVNIDIPLSSFTLVLVFLLFIISFTDTTSSSISIERNNFWIMKMLPLLSKEVLNAKIMVNKILLIPSSIIGLLLFNFSGYINNYETLLLSIIAVLYSLFISNYGMICNLLFPKLDAPNDTVIVKQSPSTMMAVLGPLIFLVILMALLLNLNLKHVNMLYIVICISGLFFLITKLIINKWGIKKYESIG